MEDTMFHHFSLPFVNILDKEGGERERERKSPQYFNGNKLCEGGLIEIPTSISAN